MVKGPTWLGTLRFENDFFFPSTAKRLSSIRGKHGHYEKKTPTRVEYYD
jgi:hypothetical protein